MLLPGLAANFVHCDLLEEGPKRVVGGRPRQVGHSMPLPGAYLETVPQRPMSYADRGRKVGERKPRALVRQLAPAKSKSVLETITFPFSNQQKQPRWLCTACPPSPVLALSPQGGSLAPFLELSCLYRLQVRGGNYPES